MFWSNEHPQIRIYLHTFSKVQEHNKLGEKATRFEKMNAFLSD